MTQEETWKPVVDYEGYYEVSNLGNIRSVSHLISGYVNGGFRTYYTKSSSLKHNISKVGYVMVSLSKQGKVKHFNLHRLVAKAFIPNPNNFPCINHKDEDKTNNNIKNLEWCTKKHNANWGSNPRRLSEMFAKKPPRHRKVSQYTMDGKFVKTFYAASHAAKELRIGSGWIIACCRGTKGAKSAGGYKWKYENE